MRKSSTTTAAGIFQFLEQTWLLSVNSHAAKYGYAQYPVKIQISRGGIASVDDRKMRQVILDKRFDADLAALMAAELARDNYKFLKRSVPRELQPTDLYMAHFLGASGATRFLVAMDSSPETPAAGMFPAATRANRSVFYNKSSQSRSLGEVHEFFRTR